MGIGKFGYFHTVGARKPIILKPADLMEELANSGVKYTKKDVLMVTKSIDGKLMWLERGNFFAGMKHIRVRHKDDLRKSLNRRFTNFPLLIKQLLGTKPLEKEWRIKGKRKQHSAIYRFKGEYLRVSYGDNGFVVSFYPDKKYKKKMESRRNAK